MYEEHPIMIQPANENIKVWRYMDFTKLISLLDTQCLYFTRVDKFDDQFEGSWPRKNVSIRTHMFDNEPLERRAKLLVSLDQIKDFNKNWPKYNAINCWHMNEHESAAMWKLYIKSNEGVAIQTTYKKLRSAIIDDEKVYMGMVKYIDYETERIVEDGNMLSPIMHKRKSFEHEHEIRAVVFKLPITIKGSLDLNKETIEHGLSIKVDLTLLIQNIYVAPSSPIWFTKLVGAAVQRYGYNIEVVNSRLNDQPVF